MNKILIGVGGKHPPLMIGLREQQRLGTELVCTHSRGMVNTFSSDETNLVQYWCPLFGPIWVNSPKYQIFKNICLEIAKTINEKKNHRSSGNLEGAVCKSCIHFWNR